MEDQFFFENIDQIQATVEPTRWQILTQLISRPMTGSQLARFLGIPRPLAHYHLQILARVGLVRFEEERQRGGVVEKYYRAVARQFRSDHLVDHYRQNGNLNGSGEKARQVVNGLITTMLEIARADLSHADQNDPLARAPFHYQEDLLLNAEQTQALIQSLRQLSADYMKLDAEHRQKLETGESDASLHHIRITWLLTPVTDPSLSADPSVEDDTSGDETLAGAAE